MTADDSVNPNLSIEDIAALGDDRGVIQDPRYGQIVLGKDEVLPTTPEAVQQELNLESQYGDAAGQAFAEGAARGATLGLSDVAGAGAGAQEGLKERKERNPISSTVGEIAGTIGGLITDVGPISATIKAGRIAEKGAELAIKKALAGTGREAIAKK